ncbi:hypothetical protein PC129_g19433 [Phytophthora cactorum]|uniref:PiggyBac transposable element-derived protein 4 C-terminal zinc-ribbon domain-containing protein n=1 Tax=Phytophthora cactorum TaxID=29920 RepID=A0A8T1FUC1_9STRA|nr:hypothetical protein PC113_g1612 [Phytophthora cactorum]KAG2979627.1 hypothetical protein PC118_g11665 [Phytophthora cactorum]KAG3209553.1 hypothetical protein PC129_g19433 [Phytophthora cactorum]
MKGIYWLKTPDKADTENGKKSRHMTCKVCAIYKVVPRKFTKYVCPECSEGTKRLIHAIYASSYISGDKVPQEVSV